MTTRHNTKYDDSNIVKQMFPEREIIFSDSSGICLYFIFLFVATILGIIAE